MYELKRRQDVEGDVSTQVVWIQQQTVLTIIGHGLFGPTRIPKAERLYIQSITLHPDRAYYNIRFVDVAVFNAWLHY